MSELLLLLLLVFVSCASTEISSSLGHSLSKHSTSLHSSSATHGGGGMMSSPVRKQHTKKSGRIAVLWVYTGTTLPFHFDLTLATLLNGGAHNVDVHVIMSGIPEKYQNTSWLHADIRRQLFFHLVSGQMWHDKIKTVTNIDINYDMIARGKKVADFKPMLAALFPEIIHGYSFWVFGDNDGLFGSYDQILDMTQMAQYDVVSGYSVVDPSITVLAGSLVHSTGAWTALRVSAKINHLFTRSEYWQTVVKNGEEIYAFDEATRPKAKGEESFSSLLEWSSDVRHCCMKRRLPHVRKSKSSTFIVEMTDRMNNMAGGKMTVQWRKNVGLNVTVDGPFGFAEVYKYEVVQPLFFHFLQWKYTCWSELEQSMTAFIAAVEAGGRRTVFDLNCFMFVTSLKTFNWTEC